MNIKKKGLLTLTSIYAILMTVTVMVCVSLLTNILRQKNTPSATVDGDSEYIYVYVTEPEPVTEAPVTDPAETVDEGWLVKEYDQRIGIFRLDGSLLYVLDTYTKTLPKADRDLLKEGISIQTKEELYALIEDYTS